MNANINVTEKTTTKDLCVTGNVDIDETIVIDGIATFNSNVDVNANINVTEKTTTKDLCVTGNVDIDGTLNVDGIATFNSNVDVNANINVTETTNTKDLCVGGNLQVNTITAKTGDTISILSNVVIGNLQVTGELIANVSGFILPDPLVVNTLIANTVCSLGNVETNTIKAKTGNTISIINNVTVMSNVTASGFYGDITSNIVTGNTVCVNDNLLTNTISPKTGGDVTINGNLIVTGSFLSNILANIPDPLIIDTLVANIVCSLGNVETDAIKAKTGNTISILDNLNISGNIDVEKTLRVDIIDEQTPSSGVTIDGILLKDGNLAANVVCATNYIETDQINAKTTGNVVIKGNLLPDTANTYSIGTIDSKWDNIVTKDLTVCGNLTADTVVFGDCLTYRNDKVTTSDATSTTLQTISTTTDTVYLFEFKIVALRDDGSEGGAWNYQRSYKNDGGTITKIGGNDNVQFKDAGAWMISINISGTDIMANVQGQVSKTIMWGGCTSVYSLTL